jgi:predicted MPP superfamily phosphohydrolase
VALTLSGQTHGGQIRLFGHPLVTPSRLGERYTYGHVVEEGRDLIVSGGLGCSIAPIRIGVPPEILSIELVSGSV